jgi:hypothetical protein
MTTRKYLRSPWDKYASALAVAVIAGCLFFGGYATAVVRTRHAARETRERACAARIEQQAARHGFSIIRAAMPCDYERSGR